MELIIGGSFQGKLEYAKQKLEREDILPNAGQILDGAALEGGSEKMQQKPVPVIFNHLHLYIRRCVRQQQTEQILPLLEQLLSCNPDLLILCDEVGYGVVPVDREEREYRERVGRILCVLAQRAEHVERVVGGLAMRVK